MKAANHAELNVWRTDGFCAYYEQTHVLIHSTSIVLRFDLNLQEVKKEHFVFNLIGDLWELSDWFDLGGDGLDVLVMPRICMDIWAAKTEKLESIERFVSHFK